MSKELAKTYDPHGLEDRIYSKWLEKKYFHAEVDRSKKPFTIVIPPPNITGQLHMGHALDNTMQDILIRLHWRRKWQPTPVFLPGESRGRRSLVGCCLWVAQSRTRLKRLSSSSSNIIKNRLRRAHQR